jgi:hypothetical protein
MDKQDVSQQTCLASSILVAGLEWVVVRVRVHVRDNAAALSTCFCLKVCMPCLMFCFVWM